MKILIVDDESLARERLVSLLEELPGEYQLAEAVNGKQAIEQQSEFAPDVMLLDIRMPVMDGLEVAQHLKHLEQPPAIVFTTAYGDHALDAFDAAAVDYLLKPIKLDRLQAALEKSQQLQHGKQSLHLNNETTQRTHLSTKTGVGLKLVAVSDIRYFKAEQKYVVAVHDEGELLLDETLKALEEEFSDQFIRIHRNTLVAIQAIQALERQSDGGQYLALQGIDQTLSVSRRHLSQVKKTLKALGE